MFDNGGVPITIRIHAGSVKNKVVIGWKINRVTVVRVRDYRASTARTTYSILPLKFSFPGILRIASQYIVVEMDDNAHTRRNTIEGTNQPASANMFGSEGTPGPVMLLISSATDANMPMVFPPPNSVCLSPSATLMLGTPSFFFWHIVARCSLHAWALPCFVLAFFVPYFLGVFLPRISPKQVFFRVWHLPFEQLFEGQGNAPVHGWWLWYRGTGARVRTRVRTRVVHLHLTDERAGL